jgi:hypothetical protein
MLKNKKPRKRRKKKRKRRKTPLKKNRKTILQQTANKATTQARALKFSARRD